LARADPKSIKKTVKLSIFFTLSGYTGVKAASKILEKLTQGVLPHPIYTHFHRISMQFWRAYLGLIKNNTKGCRLSA